MIKDEIESRREKARNKRYKAPIVENMNVDIIREKLWEIQDECGDVRYFDNTSDNGLLDELIGGEEEAFEFRMMFSSLSVDCERMLDDIDAEWIPDCFDYFFVSVASPEMTYLGYDSFENDYMGLRSSYEEEIATKNCFDRMMKMTKKDILEAARQCFRVYRNFISLLSRYEDLKGSMDIIRSQNTGYLAIICEIEKAYLKADDDDFREYERSTKAFQKLINELPDEIWVQ